MSVLGDAASALKNIILMQSNIERLGQSLERQDRDIAGLREAIAKVSERLVRIETIVDEARADARARRALPRD